jgi:hypothetical protein
MGDADDLEIYRGSYGHFHWCVSDFCLEDLLIAYPTAVLGKYVAITALDSGPVRGLSPERRNSGWEIRNEIAYSPNIAEISELFFENSFDEWYLSLSPLDLGRRVAEDVNIFATPLPNDVTVPFVNHFVRLHSQPDPTLSRLFWNQITRINPHLYLSDDQTRLTIISSDLGLIEECCKSLIASNFDSDD